MFLFIIFGRFEGKKNCFWDFLTCNNYNLFLFSGYAICRYRKSSLQSGLVKTFIRASVNSWLLTKSNPSLEVPKLSPGNFFETDFIVYPHQLKQGQKISYIFWRARLRSHLNLLKIDLRIKSTKSMVWK